MKNYEHDLRRFCLSLTKNHQDAEDLFQETFNKASKFLRENSESITNPRGFLFKIARNHFFDECRKRKCRGGSHLSIDEVGDIHSRLVDGGDSGPLSERAELMALAVKKLPTNQRELIEKVFYHGFTSRELAEQEGKSPQSIDGRLVRARFRLLREFEKLKASAKRTLTLSQQIKTVK
jgi:RNA polymerase sigma-70 factor (ECF subfamily)